MTGCIISCEIYGSTTIRIIVDSREAIDRIQMRCLEAVYHLRSGERIEFTTFDTAHDLSWMVD